MVCIIYAILGPRKSVCLGIIQFLVYLSRNVTSVAIIRDKSCGLAILAQQFEKLIHLPSVAALQHVQWQNADLASCWYADPGSFSGG